MDFQDGTRHERLAMALLEHVGARFGALVHHLVQGNTRKARRLADKARRGQDRPDPGILSQNLIESLAQEQALKNGGVNLPSIFPGLGTLVSFLLAGAENFLILDQSVTVILTLWHLHGRDDDREQQEAFVIRVLDEAYELIDESGEANAQDITRRYMTRELPQRYLNVGFNRVLNRLFPPRSRLRLVPVLGVFVSAFDGYRTVVSAGRIALNHLQKKHDQAAGRAR